ncbi:MAG: hypothetical protein WBB07_27160 [Mycobacterium sp.]
MLEPESTAARREIAPKDVFGRSNMPSRWERLTGVSPKTAPDRKYLAFVAARYRGDRRLPNPQSLAIPYELRLRERTQQFSWVLMALAVGIALIGMSSEQVPLVVVAGGLLIGAVGVMVTVAHTTDATVQRYRDLKQRAEAAHQRLHAQALHSADADTINTMITCDEGTLTYCAAKIASEIEQDPAWEASSTAFVPIDLWDELAEISASARQIATDREESENLQRGHLRDDPEIRVLIAEEKQQRQEAIALLAARVAAFADYRDRVQRHGALTRRETGTADRVARRVVDKQAGDRLR